MLIQVKVKKLRDDAILPKYAHGYQDAGADLYAVEEAVLRKNVPTLVKTGIAIELPVRYEAQIRSRSGLALKHGITVHNAPGTIDPSYRGEIGVILVWNGYTGGNNVANEEFFLTTRIIKPGDRIAQMVIAQYEAVFFNEVDELQDSSRGANGFGSTG